MVYEELKNKVYENISKGGGATSYISNIPILMVRKIDIEEFALILNTEQKIKF